MSQAETSNIATARTATAAASQSARDLPDSPSPVMLIVRRMIRLHAGIAIVRPRQASRGGPVVARIRGVIAICVGKQRLSSAGSLAAALLGTAAALSGCSHAPLATVTASPTVTGTANVTGVNIAPAAPITIVRTVKQPCAPPGEMLTTVPPLQRIHGPQKNGLAIWLADEARFEDLRARHNALSAWVKDYCQ